MSTKVMITYKRKRAASHAHTEDDTVLDSSPAASSNAAAGSLQLTKSEGPAETTVVKEDNHVRNLASVTLVVLLICYYLIMSFLPLAVVIVHVMVTAVHSFLESAKDCICI